VMTLYQSQASISGHMTLPCQSGTSLSGRVKSLYQSQASPWPSSYW
jgi:hypothetical protein